jgi:hypothetical protein
MSFLVISGGRARDRAILSMSSAFVMTALREIQRVA